MSDSIHQVLKTVREYSMKQGDPEVVLTEYESQAYERLSRFVARYFELQELHIRKAIVETEQETLQAERDHNEWMQRFDAEDEPPKDEKKK